MQAAQETFISSTNWTERIGPAAALALVRKHQRCDVGSHLVRIGKLVQDGWRAAALSVGLELEVGGIPPLGHFSLPGAQRPEAETLFTQMMLDRGFLATTGFYATFAHEDDHVRAYLGATKDVFETIAMSLADGTLVSRLRGPVAHTGFRRLT
jgi:glutamate-1-semialdehyde 2,1-aminomutase